MDMSTAVEEASNPLLPSQVLIPERPDGHPLIDFFTPEVKAELERLLNWSGPRLMCPGDRAENSFFDYRAHVGLKEGRKGLQVDIFFYRDHADWSNQHAPHGHIVLDLTGMIRYCRGVDGVVLLGSRRRASYGLRRGILDRHRAGSRR